MKKGSLENKEIKGEKRKKNGDKEEVRKNNDRIFKKYKK